MPNIKSKPDSFMFTAALFVLLAALAFAGCSGSPHSGGFGVKTLVALTADKYEDTVEISAKYDFGRINASAHYSDGEIRAVVPKWRLNDAEVDINNFYAPDNESVIFFDARYSDGEVLKTFEVKLNAVKADAAVDFSLAADSPEGSCEVFACYNSPVLKFVISSPPIETITINKLSFVIPAISDASMIDSAIMSAGSSFWPANILSSGVIEFNFSPRRLLVPKNSAVDMTLAINFNERALPQSGLAGSYAIFSDAPGSYDLRGEFFGAKAMDNLKGFPLRSGLITFKAPPSAVTTVEALAPGESHSLCDIIFRAGAAEGVSVKSFNAAAEELSFIVSAKTEAGSYSLNTAIGRQLPAPYAAISANAPNKGGPRNLTFDGQLLADRNMRAVEYNMFKEHGAPDYTAGGGLSKAPAVFKAGDLENFYVINVKNYHWHTVTAEVTAIGAHCYIFEEIDMAPRYKRLTKEKAAEIAFRFDNDIYSKVTGVFGEEPNPGIDGDSKIFILFTRIVNEGTALGYFSAINQYKRYNEQGVEMYRYSNEKEIIFSAVRDEESEFKDENGFFTLLFNVISHEFQHLINWHQHSLNGSYEETWVNEGLSMLAEDIAGYGYQSNFYARRVAEFFASADSYSLVEFKYLDRGSYGFSYLFFRYLYERGAVAANLVKSKKSGKQNVEEEIKRAGIASDFDSAFDDFLVTLYFSSKGVSPAPGYSYRAPVLKGIFDFAGALKVDIDGIAASAEITAPGIFNSRRLNGYGFNIIEFNPAAGLDGLNLYFTNKSGVDLKIIPVRFKR